SARASHRPPHGGGPPVCALWPGPGETRARLCAEAHRADDARLSATSAMATTATASTDSATAVASSDYGHVLAQRERRFAAALLAPAFLALMATTTFPLMFLVWNSAFRIDLAMPFANALVALPNY